MPVPAVARGMTCSRIWFTRALVAGVLLAGGRVGDHHRGLAVRAHLHRADARDARGGGDARGPAGWCWCWVRAAQPPRSAARRSRGRSRGPSSRSWRSPWCPRAWLDSSGMLSFMLSAGAARTRISAVDARREHGRPPLDHRRPPLRRHAGRAAPAGQAASGRPAAAASGAAGSRDGLASRVPGEAEQRGQQGQRAEQHHGDGGGGRDGDPVEQRLAQHQQPEHPDDHRGARDQHGPARGAHRGHRGVHRRPAPLRSASRNRVTMNSA